MTGDEDRTPGVVEWAIAGAPLEGEQESGDLHVVVELQGGALVGAIDGLGHGPEAALAARAAGAVLEAAARDPLASLFERCHEAIRRTRGVVMTVAAIDARAGSMTWIGVGNVEAVLLRGRDDGATRESVGLRGGVVGYQLPPLKPSVVAVAPGDVLVLVTDGIRSSFRGDLTAAGTPAQLAGRILAEHSRGTDDALVVVARYLGAPSPGNRSIHLALQEEADVAIARIRAHALAIAEGFGAAAAGAIATAVSEVARNVVLHAGEGELVLSAFETGGRRVVEVIACDGGPGIPDVARALAGGRSTKGGLGHGLAGARGLMDELTVSSVPGIGTTVTMRKWAHGG